jgi:hypothetical protein
MYLPLGAEWRCMRSNYDEDELMAIKNGGYEEESPIELKYVLYGRISN